MPDFLRPLKLEDTNVSGGSDFDFMPTPIDPTEDILWAYGLAVQNFENTILLDTSGNLAFTDQVNGIITNGNAIRIQEIPVELSGLADQYLLQYDLGQNKFIVSDGSSIQFGVEYSYEEDNPTDTTSSSVYQQKLSLTIDASGGQYLLFWAAELGATKNNGIIQYRVQVDNTTDIIESTSRPFNVDTTQIASFSEITLSAASHTIDLDYRLSLGAGTVSIANAKLFIWKVS